VLEPLVQLATGSDSSRVPIVVARNTVTSGGVVTTTTYFNEDSTNFEFDETNLFEVNKSPGFDLYEGGTAHEPVGGRATVNLGDGRSGSLLVGRSLRTKVDPLMPDPRGLDQKASPTGSSRPRSRRSAGSTPSPAPVSTTRRHAQPHRGRRRRLDRAASARCAT
jgi:lipopolysaccharide assembly outer membrane protein LptD (OstA)